MIRPHRHRAVFHALVLTIGFSLASAFGSMPAPDPGDGAQTRKIPDFGWFYPAGIDLLWWLRR